MSDPNPDSCVIRPLCDVEVEEGVAGGEDGGAEEDDGGEEEIA